MPFLPSSSPPSRRAGSGLTAQQIQAVQASFEVIARQPAAVAQHFYQRLFELDPTLRPLFRHDLAEQGDRLMAVFATAVRGLGRVETLAPALAGLGARHVDYGIRDAHYDTVAAALLDTLAAGLGDGFTPAVRDAWTVAYGVLTGAMKAGAERALVA